MKTFFLPLILSLMTTGCEASSDVKGCVEGWVEFTCKYPETNRKYNVLKVSPTETTTLRRKKDDEMIDKGRVSLYHNIGRGKLKVAIRKLQHADFGDDKCEFYQGHKLSKEDEVELIFDDDGCRKPFSQTAYRTAKTTINCDFTGTNYISNVNFFCKDNGLICEDIFSTSSSVKSNGAFTLTDTDTGFNVSISKVSSQDAGVYWCGIESNTGSYRTAVSRIQLEVQVPPNTSTPVATANGASVIIPVVVCAVVLVLVLILVLLYKRFKCSKNAGNGDAQNAKEDRFYEEIQERPQKADVGTALTVYATANFPTHPPALNQQPNVTFQNSSDKVDGDTYSTVENAAQCPAYSTVNLPSTLPDDAFYSTLSHPQ